MTRVIVNFAVIFIIYSQVSSIFSAKIHKCLSNQMQDGTFIELENFMQGIITNKRHFLNNSDCNTECEELESNLHDEFIAYDATCFGKIGACSKFQSTICSGKIQYCLSPNANKRYTWASDIDEIYRARGKCENSTYQNGGRCAESTYKCNHCMCICTEDNNATSNSVRSFSFHLQEADTNQNMVVTGLKIVKINTMIHLQIQQAKLLPNNKIDSKTKSWKPLDEIVNLSNHSQYPNDWKNLTADEDYMSLSFANRTINLDDIILPLDYVLSGVRFGRTLSEDQQTSALRIELKGVYVDRKIGKIIPNKEIYLTPDDMESNRLLPDYQRLRTQITLDNCDDPVEAKSYTRISETNKYIKFTHTDKKKDLAQTTIPYFDAREFSVEDDLPLIGLSLTYAGREGYGGFVTFNLYPSYIKNETSYITKQNVNLETCLQPLNITDDSTKTLDKDLSRKEYESEFLKSTILIESLTLEKEENTSQKITTPESTSYKLKAQNSTGNLNLPIVLFLILPSMTILYTLLYW